MKTNKSSRNALQARILACAIAFAISQAALAGDTTGSIAGAVNGANQAQIIIKNLDTGFSRNITTDNSGRFLIPQLPIGRYTITLTDRNSVIQEKTVDVRIGSTVNIAFMAAKTLDSVQVRGSDARALIDVVSTDTGLQLSKDDIDKLPVARNAGAVALLAPGVVAGDSGFGNLPSFGGASVAENVYYLNGLNITNPRNGLGGSEVPFEFFKDFQIKTGGYSAEFGRSTGGVVNAISKTGSNTWEGSANVIYTPRSLNKNSPDVHNSNGDLVVSNRYDKTDTHELNIQVGGPIIPDHLFFYTLVNPRWNSSSDYQADWTENKTSSNALFWGASVNWLINDNHRIDFTAFSDKDKQRRRISDWDPDLNEVISAARPSIASIGGNNTIIKYTGNLSDSFTVSAMWGQAKFDGSEYSELDDNPVVYYTNDGANFIQLGNWAVYQPGISTDQRTAMRLDFDWFLGDHRLRFGIDQEQNTSVEQRDLSGGVEYNIYDYPVDPYVTVYHEHIAGHFKTRSNAYYIEDTLSLGHTTTTLGLRNEKFQNLNGSGGKFLDMNNQWAPRLGFAWDIGGDGNDKLYANIGR